MLKNIKLSLIIISVLTAFVFLTSCRGVNNKTVSKKHVTSTHEVAAGIAENIGGAFVTVTTIINNGSDPHNFKPGESDIIKVADADIVLYNGYFLEGRLAEVLSSSDKASTTIPAMAGVKKEDLIKNLNPHYKFNPHFWHDIRLYEDSVKSVTNKLVASSKENEVIYRRNEDNYLLKLEVAKKEIEDIIKRVPENKRKLATIHNAFEYFGRANGFETKSLIGVDTTEEVLPSDINEFVTYIVDNSITTIFSETTTPQRIIDSLNNAFQERGYTVTIVGQLYADTLIEVTKNRFYNDRYIETMIFNANLIADTLSQ